MAGSIQFEEDSPKAEILQAALEEFVEFGSKGARMQSIADRAGVNKALLHYYFANKKNLHQEVLRRIFRKALTQISRSLDVPSDPERQICMLVRQYFRFIREFPELPRLMIHEISSNPDQVADLFSKLFTETHHFPGAIIDILRNGMEKGQFRKTDPQQTLISILSTVIFYFIAKPLLRNVLDIKDEETFLDERVNHVENFVMHALKRSS